ncbi:MAG: calcineurin-like phosphoesterase [Paenibacillus sp.]|nr:calcineurin-like phosphoesterase [Paenibacillus sp.]
MRVVILGDFHLDSNALDLSEQAMADIAACAPDLVVALGDFGSGRDIGSIHGLDQAYSLLSTIGTQVRPILGNHDMQRETGYMDMQPKGTMERYFRELFHLDRPYGVMEFERFRFVFVSTDLQPEDSCYQVQECYVSEVQWHWIETALLARPNVPVIMFTHAPPIGAGLRTVPGVHVRATNAYLDQNHRPAAWLERIKRYPEIILWFSAHYHLSHIYPDSQTVRDGTTFFSTGVHGKATRDGHRVSRVLDITEHGIAVHTLNHESRQLEAAADWSSGRTAEALVQEKRHLLATSYVPAERPASIRCSDSFSIGDAEVLPKGMRLGQGGLLYAATADGFLWETIPAWGAVMGTLHYDKQKQTIAAFAVSASPSQTSLWKAWGQHVQSIDPQSPQRFVRELQDRYDEASPFPRAISSITLADGSPGKDDTVWVAAGDRLFSGAAAKQTTPLWTDLGALPETIAELGTLNGKLMLFSASGTLYMYNPQVGTELAESGVTAWDVCGDSLFTVVDCDKHIRAVLQTDGQRFETTIAAKPRIETNVEASQQPSRRVQIVGLSGRCALLIVSGATLLWDVSKGVIPVGDPGDTASSAAKGSADKRRVTFYLAVKSALTFARTEIRTYQYSL